MRQGTRRAAPRGFVVSAWADRRVTPVGAPEPSIAAIAALSGTRKGTRLVIAANVSCSSRKVIQTYPEGRRRRAVATDRHSIFVAITHPTLRHCVPRTCAPGVPA